MEKFYWATSEHTDETTNATEEAAAAAAKGDIREYYAGGQGYG